MIIQGDCLEQMKKLEDNSVDAIVTDPPYGIGFMGKTWDKYDPTVNKGSFKVGTGTHPQGYVAIDRNAFYDFSFKWAVECLRVLKPGGYLLSFGGTRTYHRMASAIEDAGFEIRDMIEWVYGSGFPKSLNIGKAVDKIQGNEREVVGSEQKAKPTFHSQNVGGEITEIDNIELTKGTSEWEGWGTALKPAHEPICMARKPLAEKTVAENCLKWGTGGINIDESRVEGTQEYLDGKGNPTQKQSGDVYGFAKYDKLHTRAEPNTQGRFPANLIHDNSKEVRECFPESKSQGHWSKTKTTGFGKFGNGSSEYLGVGEKDKEGGNASRFFKSIIYTAKASKSERNKGLENFEKKKVNDGRDTPIDNAFQRGETKRTNTHPTVKPIALMEYLIKMVTRESQIVLDPFTGSGTTLIAAKKLGRKYIGIELEPEYVKIAEARLNSVQKRLI